MSAKTCRHQVKGMCLMLAIAVPFVAWFSVAMLGLQSIGRGSHESDCESLVLAASLVSALSARFLAGLRWPDTTALVFGLVVGWTLGVGVFVGTMNVLGWSRWWAILLALPAPAWIVLTIYVARNQVRAKNRPLQNGWEQNLFDFRQ